MKNILIILLFTLIIPNYSNAAKDNTPKASISAGDLASFMDEERDFLRGEHKVNLVKKFISKSNVKAQRYGNSKKVLNLKGLSLSGLDLRDAIFTMANMSKTSLKGANLRGSDFVHVDFTGADLRNADLSKADLSNAIFENTDIEGTNFKGANLFKATFAKMKVSRKELKKLERRTKFYVDLAREPLIGDYDE